MNDPSSPPKHWWETVPGILAGVAALITAIAGLIALYMPSRPANGSSVSIPDSVTAPSPHREPVFLSDQPPSDILAEPHGGLGRDKAYWSDQVVLNGRHIQKSLVMHANAATPAIVGYVLSEPFSRFEAIVGLSEPRCDTGGSAQFTVRVDGDTRFTSGILHFGQQESVRVPLQGAKVLSLEVNDAGDGNACDQATWVEPRLIPGGT